MTPQSPYLTPADAALLLRVTPATIRQLVRRGELRVAATTERGGRLFQRKDVEALALRRIKEEPHAR